MSAPQKNAGLEFHYNTTELRQETWNRLKVTAAKHYEREQKGLHQRETEATIAACFDILEPVERYWAYPGKATVEELRAILASNDAFLFMRAVSHVVRGIISESYRRRLASRHVPINDLVLSSSIPPTSDDSERNYFEVLVVDNLHPEHEVALRDEMRSQQDPKGTSIYDVIVAPSFEDALLAVILNPNIQCVVIRYGFPVKSDSPTKLLGPHVTALEEIDVNAKTGVSRSLALGSFLHKIRPEIDLYLVTDAGVEEASVKGSRHFRRIFYRNEDYLELHLSICRGIRERYHTPFFNALIEFSKRPTGVFHAMPLSRGNSVYKTHWIKDMGDFYGKNIFLAETSATTGGLDSLLNPTGPLKEAQERAAKAFGAMFTYFVTNGTSTANKIVQLALLKPGDIVLIDRDCHKSHHYGIMLSGGCPVYLDAYPLREYSIYGGVPLLEIKRTLLRFKREGKLDRVRMLVLTNSTFDGLIYDPMRVMQELLAIKPDLIFLWDEAWFGFAHFHHMYRRRAAMSSAKRLNKYLRSDAYREFKTPTDFSQDDDTLLSQPWFPDPDRIKIRVYATHSTHKTLSSLRQGSMIHIYDECFYTRTESFFNEAYMTHTSTSPNYQILASLDVARRQAELEGYELVQKSIEMAMIVRETLKTQPLLKRYFSCLGPGELIPSEFRPSGFEHFFKAETGWVSAEPAWQEDEFVLDPTRITLYIGRTGIDGDTFRKTYLMDKFGIQVNKTSRNTILMMTNIGSNRSAIAFLISVLIKIAKMIRNLQHDLTPQKHRALTLRIQSLTEDLPPLPHFSGFHPFFQAEGEGPAGDMRRAYYLAYDRENCAYEPLCEELVARVRQGTELVSTTFVTPYPPGFPILVPGQVVSPEILEFLLALDVKEIHGYNAELGLKVFRAEALNAEALNAEALNAETLNAEALNTGESASGSGNLQPVKAVTAGESGDAAEPIAAKPNTKRPSRKRPRPSQPSGT
ncbi:aminotransferase class I/II-fold pyridoxal phosphate-dependent enzyme [Acanthopleuribacter pedis]|uniref:Aminotransferase class I/II-fold pyridoxal phosphate-dependent enzyme n=1 Tax=Acanthopleuribacter pedis TaxID=442870 RepID=A0A8J7Q890_9BACT|nr:aminotransferase class I/II-fold pyridoxal phosphate-dependent enzyme [Acanthopleuribacter pedis]MBO1319512.1 aminotransferase class I/II-fold pyridoxal phosphate-dependent enzyme [Acanthopleuribacter pedis]